VIVFETHQEIIGFEKISKGTARRSFLSRTNPGRQCRTSSEIRRFILSPDQGRLGMATAAITGNPRAGRLVGF